MRTVVVIFIFCFVETFGYRTLEMCRYHSTGCEDDSRGKCMKQVNATENRYDVYPTIVRDYHRNDGYLLDDNKEKACEYELCMKKEAEIIKEDGSIDIENAYTKFSINKIYRDEYIAKLQECQIIGKMCDKLKCLIKAHELPNNRTMKIWTPKSQKLTSTTVTTLEPID